MDRLTAAALLLWCAAALQAAQEQPPLTRDAAQAVQEGDVSQWLQYYQRERGEEWNRQREDAPPAGQEPAPAVQDATQRN